MSGHSKWAQIKRQKGVADTKRGQAFTKMAGAIAIAVRQGGGADPASNFKLRLAIEKARSLNMPKQNIERAIERGSGSLKGESLEETVYEGFAPGGVAVIIEAATDNKLRTTGEVKNIFDKNNATLGVPGSVSYQFETKGLITVKKDSKTLDEIFLLAADKGAEDIEESDGEVLIYTKPSSLYSIKEALSGELSVVDAELTRKPTVTVAIDGKDLAQKVLSFLDKLESLDDVQKVYANFDIQDAVFRQ